MTMSMSELRSTLSSIEANESMYAGIGPDEVPLLVELLDDEEGWLAARAAHALARLDAEGARDAVRTAAQSERPEVREAVAAAAGQLPAETSDAVLSMLLTDDDAAVRKLAIKSTSSQNNPTVWQRINELSSTEPDVAVRAIAERRLETDSPG